jgi:hypothetical protein
MKHLRLLVPLAAASLFIMIIGCAKEPIREMGMAKAAVDSAKAVQADLYLPDQFSSVNESLNAALSDIDRQKTASALKRSYDKDKQSLMSVVSSAADLKAKASEEKARVQSEVEASIARATSAIADFKAGFKKPPKSKKARAAVYASRGKLAAVEALVKDAQNAQAAGDVLGAREKANSALAKIESVKAEQSAPVSKTAKPKSKHKTKPKKHRR